MFRQLALLVLVTCVCADAWGDDAPDAAANADPPAFYLEDGDRVVLLGGTIIEREQVYGEWELMLTCLYADADFTVRNLGWSGDTVWAESRGIFDPPEVGYQRMIDQIRDLSPTVVLLAYGHNEAWAGEAGLDAFITQYEKLIDDIQAATEAETRYLILVPHLHLDVSDEFTMAESYNSAVLDYWAGITQMAHQRGIPRVFAFDPTVAAMIYEQQSQSQRRGISADGVQLSQHGYFIAGTHLASQFSRFFHRTSYFPSLSILDGEVPQHGVTAVVEALDQESGSFRVRCTRVDLVDHAITVLFDELDDGPYRLTIDGKEILTLDAAEWQTIHDIATDPDSLQREALRQAIIRKNELYFHRWRPQNVTYLFGFRAHEQGNNAVEIPQFDPLIEEQEALIRELKHPVEHVWELAPAE